MMVPRKQFALSLGLVTAFALSCGGGDEGGKVGVNNDDNNTTANNTTPNNTTPNNTTPNNTTPNNTTPNNTTPNNTTPNNTNQNNLMGELMFAQPGEETVYTNSTVSIEIDPQGDVEDAELVLDEDEVLYQFGATSTFEWDTTSRAEGSYELLLRWSLGGVPRWSDDTRTVIVDRTNPALASSIPADGTEAGKNTPITATFDEPLDPASVNASNVTLTFDNGQTTAYTVNLSADGQTIAVQFDRDTIDTPYTATVAFPGVMDLAGNSTFDSFDYRVAAWVEESFAASLNDLEYAVLNGSEYIIGWVEGSPNDMLRVFKYENNTWNQVVSEPMNQIYDLDVDIEVDRAHIAVLHRTSGGGLILKGAQLLEFNPVNDTATMGGSQVVGPDSSNGAIAIDVLPAALGSIDAIATVSDGQVRVYETVNRNLTNTTQNTFPTANFSNVRDEDLAVGVKNDGLPEVIFMRCSSAAVPCVRTFGERSVKSNSGWASVGSTSTPFVSGVSATCDEYVNFEAIYTGGAPTMLFAYHAPCDAPEPGVRTLAGGGSGWTNLLGSALMNSLPDPDTKAYSSHLAIDDQGQVHALVASDTRMLIAWFDMNGVANWLAPVAQRQMDIGQPRLFIDANGDPIVLYRAGNQTRVVRVN